MHANNGHIRDYNRFITYKDNLNNDLKEFQRRNYHHASGNNNNQFFIMNQNKTTNKPNKIYSSSNCDYALKIEKMVDFIPKNLSSYSELIINNNNNNNSQANILHYNKIKNDSNTPNDQKINQEENTSINSSIGSSIGTSMNLISSSYEDEEINFRKTNTGHHKLESNANNSFFNSIGNKKTIIDNKFNSDFCEKENFIIADFPYFSNLQSNSMKYDFPIIDRPKTCNININLNPQIYGNILVGNNQEFANYLMYSCESQETNIFDDQHFLNKSNNSNNNKKLSFTFPPISNSIGSYITTENHLNPVKNSNSNRVNLSLKDTQTLLTPAAQFIISKEEDKSNNQNQTYIGEAEIFNKFNINSSNFKNNYNSNYNPNSILNKKTNYFSSQTQQQRGNDTLVSGSNELSNGLEISNHLMQMITKHNFCNWFSFMTNTTPLLFKSESLTLKKFFSSFEKSSIFGVDCTFRYNSNDYNYNNNNGNYFHKTFQPTFSAINIDFKTSPPSTELNNTHQFQMNSTDNNPNNSSNLNSTLDGSFFSFISASECGEADLINAAKHQQKHNTVFFYEDSAMHLRPLFCDKAREFLNSHELENVTIAELGDKSWFAVLWSPQKDKNDSHPEANACFLVFYRIKPAACDRKIGFLPVIGVFSGCFADEMFWFSNQASVQFLFNKGCLQKMKEDYYNNRIAYLRLNVT